MGKLDSFGIPEKKGTAQLLIQLANGLTYGRLRYEELIGSGRKALFCSDKIKDLIQLKINIIYKYSL